MYVEKKMIAGCFECVHNVEDKGRCYCEFPDGLRLIFQDGKYVGFYNPLLTAEG